MFSRLKDKLTAEQLHTAIASEMQDYVLTTLNFKDDIDKLMLAYVEGLKGLKMFAPVTEVTLKALRNVEEAKWIAQTQFEINAIQKEIFNASFTGQWNQKTTMNNLLTGKHGNLSEGQINTLVDTSLSTFERNVNTAMMDEMPEDTLYVYVGAQDEKTRDICNEMIGAGAITEAEIISNFGASVLEVGGGFNCRHSWLPA